MSPSSIPMKQFLMETAQEFHVCTLTVRYRIPKLPVVLERRSPHVVYVTQLAPIDAGVFDHGLRKHPTLRGLKGREYQTGLMRIWRSRK